MFEERGIHFFEAKELLEKCGLNPVDCADYRMGVFTPEEELIATGALVGATLQMIAVDPAFQGEDLSVRVVSHLINYAAAHGIFRLNLFTRSARVSRFQAIGFRVVAYVEDAVALLEWGSPGIREYCRELEALRPAGGVSTGCIVMNCNPFTKGHRFLVESAARSCGRVFVLAVEEDLSEFPFSVRLELLRRGTADLDNVTVIPGGCYVISSLTFPAYFSRDEARSRLQSRIDAEIFTQHIAPALGVTDRFLGEEPLSPTTAIYNEIVSERLTRDGIRVHILPRLRQGLHAISASEVRRRLAAGSPEDVSELVPETTLSYLRANAAQVKSWVSR